MKSYEEVVALCLEIKRLQSKLRILLAERDILLDEMENKK